MDGNKSEMQNPEEWLSATAIADRNLSLRPLLQRSPNVASPVTELVQETNKSPRFTGSPPAAWSSATSDMVSLSLMAENSLTLRALRSSSRSPVVAVRREGDVEVAVADDLGAEQIRPRREADVVGPEHLLRRLRRGDHDGVDLPQPQVHHRAVLIGQVAEGCLRLRGEQVVDASDEGEAIWTRGASLLPVRSGFPTM
nr:unnamed protein product [Digitaria exilis]